MRMSETISEIATALSSAQGLIEDASKGTKNEFFKSKYADLAAVRSVIREPLAKSGLAIVQFPRVSGSYVEVETMLLHTSGEFFAETLHMPVGKPDPHGIGSAITYARRYGIMALLCIASEDDDGNAAVTNVNNTKAQEAKEADEAATDLFLLGVAEARLGMASLSAWYSSIGEKGRASMTSAQKAKLKKIATDADKEFAEDEETATA